ncbi:hypothetical protein BV25DRAFT_1832468 [Artomyces pyxidatus]|uniref:Uncharacterized protein n=1 Tax=Artomyces pyxidatus TaxID=48021 RepID=A0ACB8SJ31_9AGAM|nr:hypothetical protein BV25DRAFT_1832468 [Artomyces pyxidatus]
MKLSLILAALSLTVSTASAGGIMENFPLFVPSTLRPEDPALQCIGRGAYCDATIPCCGCRLYHGNLCLCG